MFSASVPENLKGFVGDEKAAQTKQSWPLGAAWQEVGGAGVGSRIWAEAAIHHFQ